MSSASGLEALTLFDQDDTNEAEVTTHLAPLPPVSLPAFPRPSLSPTSSKLSLRSSGQQTPSSLGLDMSNSRAYSAGVSLASPTRQQSFGQAGGDDLESDVARARQERLTRRTQSSSGTPSSPSGAASARANIMALAASGGGAKSGDGAPPSLASFMGGGAKPPRLHRVGTGPTEEEREETDRLEREMAATKQRWGKQAESTGPPAGGMSLASLLKGGVSSSAGSSSPASSSVANRWQPQEPVKSKSAPAPMMTFGTADNTLSQPHVTPPVLSSATFTAPPRSRSPSPAGRKPISIRPSSPHKPLPSPINTKAPPLSPTKADFLPPRPSSPSRPFPFAAINLEKSTPATPERSTSNPQPRSLAAMFGSTASGPRLNQQAPQHEAEEGPAHARSKGVGGFAMPGMVAAGSVRARAESLTSGKNATTAPAAPPLVEAEIISRSPPTVEQEDDDLYSPPLHQDSSPLLPDSPESLRSGRPLSRLMSPEIPSSPESTRSPPAASKPFNTDSLTRLQSSNIVADRLKWGEEKEKGAASPTESGSSSPAVAGRPTHSKRNSVMERWGRDIPNGSNESSPSSPKATAPAWTPPIEVRASKPLSERWSEKKEERASPKSSPALVHMNHGRARPPKSTPRGSANASPSLSQSSPVVDAPALASAPSPAPVAPQPSPPVDRPTEQSTSSSVQQTVADRWNAAPIGVKEVAKPKPWEQEAQTTEAPAPKHTRGVALPGMSAPPSSASSASQAGIGIGIFQRPEAGSTPDPVLAQLREPQTSSKVEHDDGFPRFQDPFSTTAAQSTGVASPVDPRRAASGSPWSKPTKQASLQDNSSSASIKSANTARSQTLPGPASPSSVRNAIASWGSPKKVSSSYNSSPTKESYGVKPRPETRSAPPSQPDFRPSPPSHSEPTPPPPMQTQQTTTVLQEASTSHPATPRLVQIADAESASQMSRQTSGDSTFTDAHEGLSPRERQSSIATLHRDSIDRAVELAKSPVLSPRVPGDSLGLDVYRLSSGEADPIDHNHVFYQTEILAIVNRTRLMGGKEVAKMWIWVGEEAREFDEKINERARKVAQAYSTVPILVRYRFEPRELVEVFGDQITICRGTREDFNHLDTKLYTVQAHEEVVFVEEVAPSSKNICAGYCAVFSLVGEVYAWIGGGCLPIEQDACEEFADTISDGRHVTVLREGSETAYFWHGLDGLEYASAHYWRFRRTHPQKVAVVSIDSTAMPIVSRVESLELSDTSISLIDGGFSEHWIVVPAAARSKRADLSIALEAADELAGLWRERGFAFKQPYHVLLFPSLIPRDLPHLARQLDFGKLNAGERPTRMNVLTPEEARHQLFSSRAKRAVRPFDSVLSLVANLSTLKAELKAWEVAFRASHGGQDPTKADIKANPEIAAKYKEYSKSKSTKAAPTSVHPSSSTSDASNSTTRGRSAQPALPASIFKTPTKPKPPKRASQSSAGAVSPAKSATGASEGGPTYVIANSPSKLRALAAAHSTFGSPNRPATLGASTGRSASKGGDGLTVVGSPKKYNPFAVGGSPVKKGIFDAEAGQKKKEKGLGKGKTREGVGWGSSDATRGWESEFSSAAPASRRMEEDEDMDETTEDDYAAMIEEALGPSPVKPAPGRRKEFKPLFDTTTQPASSLFPPPPPKPFITEFIAPRKPDKPSSMGAGLLRGLKRAPTPPTEVQKPSSDEEDEEEVVGKGSKAKRKKVAAGARGKGRAAKGKGKSGKAVDEDDGEFDGRGRTRVGSTLVLDMEAGEEGDKVDRVVIHPRRPYYKTIGKEKDPSAMDEDVQQEDDDDDDLLDLQGASLFYRDAADLLSSQQSQLDARETTPLDSNDDELSSDPRARPRTLDATIDLDTDLAAILSLRSSPIKKTAQKREKERDKRVKELLMDPGSKKEAKGLMDLAEAAGSEGEEEQAAEGSDDDWASDAEGWKDLGDGEMEGYEEAW